MKHPFYCILANRTQQCEQVKKLKITMLRSDLLGEMIFCIYEL